MNIASFTKGLSNTALFFVVLVVVTLSVWLPRLGVPYVPDDTLAIVTISTELLGDQDPASLAAINNPFGVIWDKLRNTWADSGYRFAAYRPLNAVFALKMLFWPYDPTIPTLFHAGILGITAALIYLLVVQITEKKFVGLASAMLYAFSFPSLQTTWLVIYSQPLVNLFIVLGLLAYVRYARSHRTVWLSVLWASAIIGPFFRELTVILPVTVLALVLLERRREKPLLISMPLLLGHALFPSFLPNLLIHATIVAQSNFRGGFVLQAPSEFGSGLIPRTLIHYATTAYSMPLQLELFIPPMITAIAIAGMGLFVFRHRTRYARVWRAVIMTLIIGLATGIMAALVVINIPGILPISGRSDLIRELVYRYLTYGIPPLLLFLSVPLLSLRFGKLLPVWLLIAGGPFLIIYIDQDTHIWPASIPWIIMIVLWIDYFFAGMKEWASSAQKRLVLARSLYVTFAVLLTIGLADQAWNIASVRTVWSEIAATTRQMGERLMTAPKGSMAVTNLYQAVDIEYFAHGQVKHYLSTDWKDYPIPGRALGERQQFKKALSERFSGKNVYLLAEPGGYMPSYQYIRASHQYLDDPPGDLELISRFSVHSRYYFLDPLHNIFPVAYWKKVASPELVYSFIRTGGPFYREYSQSYALYRLISFSPKTNEGK